MSTCKCGGVRTRPGYPCHKCQAAYQRSWTARNPERARNIKLAYRYGITLEEYEGIWEAQRGKCPICRETLSGSHTHIDHDHASRRVRGLLCSNCNRGLGLLGDDPQTIDNARRYLRSGMNKLEKWLVSLDGRTIALGVALCCVVAVAIIAGALV